MKKKFLCLFSVLLICLFGCAMGNSPTKKVEKVLMKYQSNDSSITTELDDYLNTINAGTDYYEDYKKVYLKQYSDLKYKMKDETIDGDHAKVTAEVEVYDYYNTETNVTNYIATNPTEFSENGVYSTKMGVKYKVDELNKTTDRVTYTIVFNLTKVNDEWTVDTLTNEELEKIHGTFAH